MNIVFTFLAINCGNPMYLEASSNLINEIIEQTNFDIILTTNEPKYFSNKPKERVHIREITDKSISFKFDSGFNYNLKYLCFENIPSKYDAVIYLDGDIKLNGFRDESINLIKNILTENEVIGTRFNAVLRDEFNYYTNNISDLFTHKIKTYEIDKYELTDKIFNSRLPSEHFLILKNVPNKVSKFAEHWASMNKILEKKNGIGGAHCDAFEIGISLNEANFEKIYDIQFGDSMTILGFIFNGNKK